MEGTEVFIQSENITEMFFVDNFMVYSEEINGLQSNIDSIRIRDLETGATYSAPFTHDAYSAKYSSANGKIYFMAFNEVFGEEIHYIDLEV